MGTEQYSCLLKSYQSMSLLVWGSDTCGIRAFMQTISKKIVVLLNILLFYKMIIRENVRVIQSDTNRPPGNVIKCVMWENGSYVLFS